MHPVELSSITIHGRPVTKLYHGWKAMGRYHVTSELDVIHLRELESEKDAFWWLNKEGQHLASHTAALPKEEQNRLIASIEPALMPLQMNMQYAVPVALSKEAEDIRGALTELPYQATFEIIMLWCSAKLSKTMIFPPDAIIDASITLDENQIIKLSTHALSQMMETSFTAEEALPPPSPFSDRRTTEQLRAQLPVGPFARFYDNSANVVFYLFWHGRVPGSVLGVDNRAVTFYYPRGCLLIGDCPTSDLIPLWLMFFFLFYNNELTDVPLEPAFPSGKAQAKSPSSFFFANFNSDLTSLISLDDLKQGKFSTINEIINSDSLPPMDPPFNNQPFTSQAYFPFSPLSKPKE